MRVALSFWITTESIIEVNIQGSTYVLKRPKNRTFHQNPQGINENKIVRDLVSHSRQTRRQDKVDRQTGR